MKRTLDTTAYLDTVCELLKDGHTDVPVPVTGSSMTPFLHNGDTAYVNLPQAAPRPGDIALYQRASGQYILHRVIRCNPDGSHIMLGDAQTEREYLPAACPIHAIVTRAVHKGKTITPRSIYWILYATLWRWVNPIRPVLVRIRNLLPRKTR